jgi:hypothetical protein
MLRSFGRRYPDIVANIWGYEILICRIFGRMISLLLIFVTSYYVRPDACRRIVHPDRQMGAE